MKPKPTKRKPETPRELALYRARSNCRIGKAGMDDKLPAGSVPPGRTSLEWGVYTLLSAVENLAEAMELEGDGQ
jgi:hypothetical protein